MLLTLKAYSLSTGKACGFGKTALEYSIFYLPKIISVKKKMSINNIEN